MSFLGSGKDRYQLWVCILPAKQLLLKDNTFPDVAGSPGYDFGLGPMPTLN